MQEFETGDIVRLKSGGPKMTVADIHISGSVHCQWFAGSKSSDGYFPPESLIKIEEQDEENEG